MRTFVNNETERDRNVSTFVVDVLTLKNNIILYQKPECILFNIVLYTLTMVVICQSDLTTKRK